MKLREFEFDRGADIILEIDVETGTVASVSDISGHLRALADGKVTLTATAPKAAEFTFQSRGATVSLPEGWTATIAGATAINLAVGRYLTDVRMVAAGAIIYGERAIVIIREPATLPV